MTQRFLLVALTSLSVFLAAAPAFAQDDPAAADDAPAEEGATDDDIMGAIEEAGEEAAEEAAPADAEAVAEEVKPAATGKKSKKEKDDVDPLQGMSKDDELYWATMRSVFTLQQRRFQKSKRFGITVYGGLIPNNIFEQYIPLGLRLNYFILENIGIELAGSYAFKVSTGLENQIREENGIGAGQVLIGDTQVSHTNFGIVWSPFYGKGAFYNSGLVHFDLYLFAGAGIVIKETTPNFNADPEQEIKPEGALGGGLAMFLGNHFAVRADFRQFVFQKIVGGVANPSEVSLGLSYFF